MSPQHRDPRDERPADDEWDGHRRPGPIEEPTAFIPRIPDAPAEPDRVVAERGSHPVVTGGRRIALVEHEIEHLEHRREAFDEIVKAAGSVPRYGPGSAAAHHGGGRRSGARSSGT